MKIIAANLLFSFILFGCGGSEHKENQERDLRKVGNECLQNEELTDGKCHPAPSPVPTCPEGQSSVDGCRQVTPPEPPVVCPHDQELINGECRQVAPPAPPVVCPRDQEPTNGECRPVARPEPSVSCLDGQVLVGGECRSVEPIAPSTTCPEGQILVNGECQASPSLEPVPNRGDAIIIDGDSYPANPVCKNGVLIAGICQPLAAIKLTLQTEGSVSLSEAMRIKSLLVETMNNLNLLGYTFSVPSTLKIFGYSTISGPSWSTGGDSNWIGNVEKTATKEDVESLLLNHGIKSSRGFGLTLEAEGKVSLKEILLVTTKFSSTFAALQQLGYSYKKPLKINVFGFSTVRGPFWSTGSENDWIGNIEKDATKENVESLLISHGIRNISGLDITLATEGNVSLQETLLVAEKLSSTFKALRQMGYSYSKPGKINIFGFSTVRGPFWSTGSENDWIGNIEKGATKENVESLLISHGIRNISGLDITLATEGNVSLQETLLVAEKFSSTFEALQQMGYSYNKPGKIKVFGFATVSGPFWSTNFGNSWMANVSKEATLQNIEALILSKTISH